MDYSVDGFRSATIMLKRIGEIMLSWGVPEVMGLKSETSYLETSETSGISIFGDDLLDM